MKSWARLNLTVLFSMFLLQNIFGQGFYDIEQINNIEIGFAQSNWDYLLDSLVADGQEVRLTGSVIINGQVFDSVGVRYKGNSSYNPGNVKNPLNIKLDYMIDDQLIENYGTIKLANVFKDPSFVRETLSYEIARKYFPASLSNYAKVTINGTYIGLYTSDQDVDKYFMRSHFSSDENARIKGEILENTMPGSMGGVWEYFGPDSADYFGYYALESDFGWQDLIAFLDTLNNHTAEIENVLNVDRHLWFLAFQNLLVNLDGPINNPQNYYIYKDDAGRFNPIPWDLNESFGVFTMLQSSGPLSPSQLMQLDPFVNVNVSEYPVINKILSNDRYRKMYVAHMKTIIDENFSNGWYYDRALELQDIIDEEVAVDPNKFYSYTDFGNNLSSSVVTGPRPEDRIIGITELMNSRINWLSSQADFLAEAPVIGEIAHTPETLVSGTEIHFTATAGNSAQVWLYYRLSDSDRFTAMEMFDDGNHDDGDAGDGVFGSSAFPAYSDIQYYCYAENGLAGAFMPEHAANQSYTVTVVSDIVINEFLADNGTVAADQDGEYDDWIELYNNSGSDINLAGYALSDDGTDLQQWTFPDTVIHAHDYLIVWADSDDEQAGLHANFKLSASGEAIYLLNPSAQLIDEVHFADQAEDLSTGRYPDGTGDFVQMVPTFSASNNMGTAVPEESDKRITGFELQQNYPNPFNPETMIEYHVPAAGNLNIVVYSMAGQKIKTLANGWHNAGSYQVPWNGTNEAGIPVASGVYFYRLSGSTYSAVKKMILIR
jgi:hypothetical protein